MMGKGWALIPVLGSGLAAILFLWRKIPDIEIIIEADLPPEKRELEIGLFDCPACGLPAEVNTIVTEMSQEGFFVTNYIIACLGDHDRVAVTEKWLAEYFGEIR